MTGEAGNGNVTIAMLQADIRHLTGEVARMNELLTHTCEELRGQRDRMVALETRREIDAKLLEKLSERVDKLDTRDRMLALITGLLGTIGAAGWFKP